MNGVLVGKKALLSFGIVIAVTILLVFAALAGAVPEEKKETTVVPFAYAVERGAREWDISTERAFFESPENLWLLSEAQLEARDGRGPGEWLPPLDQCLYLSRFVGTLREFGLDGNKTEMRQLAAQRQRCYTQFQ